MFSVLIVDDEFIIRRGLRMILPWTALGFDEVYEAINAKEALSIVAQTPISLVITDICMPEIDGIELTQRLIAMQPNIRIIVITGYERFEYAQKCCAIGVRHLLLKPIDELEIGKILAIEAQEMRMERRDDQQDRDMARRKLFSEELLRKKLFSRLVSGRTLPDDEGEVKRFFHIEPHSGMYAVALSPIVVMQSEWSTQQEFLLESIATFLNQMMNEKAMGWCFNGSDGEVLGVMSTHQTREATLEDFCDVVEEEYSTQMLFGLSECVTDVHALAAAFAQARANQRKVHAQGKESDKYTSDSTLEIVRRAKQIISTRYHEKLSVAALAEELYISLHYFSRMFKKLVGVGCNEYITKTRILAAKQMLIETNMRCFEIADAVGYQDTNYFSMTFKKMTGMTPETYRMAVKERDQAAPESIR